MADLDVLTYGFAFVSDQGSFGWSSVSLVTIGDRKLMIDTGPSSRRAMVYGALQSRGLEPEDIDTVILTHLHWDHCQNVDLFRNARVLVHSKELDYARSPKSGDLAFAAGVPDVLGRMTVEPVSDGDVVAEGLSVIATPGHTKGHLSILADVDGDRVLIAGDAMPDAGTVRRGLPYNVFWDTNEAAGSVEKMLDSSRVFYPGHDRPFRLEGDEISYLEGPTVVNITDSNEGGAAPAVAFKVTPRRAVNIDMVQKD